MPPEPTHLIAGLLRLQFTWVGDRYGHRILSVADGRELACSVEGVATETWPPSPPLQELHFSTTGDGRQVALGVGRAGTQHWSLSFEPQPTGWLVDVACRVRGAVDRLASRYRLPHAGARSPAERACPVWIEPSSREPGVCTVLRQAELSIVMPRFAAGDMPRTIRWRYVIESGPLCRAGR